MLLMFPLGLGYFVFLVVSLALGGAMIWTIVGPVVLLACLFISRWLGDLEAVSTGYVNGVAIRRPPSRLEGVTNLRSQVQVRLVDPTTWTGLVYLAIQWLIGVVAFVGLVVAGVVSVAFMFAPAIVSFTDQPLEVVWPSVFSSGDGIVTLETPLEALQLTPLGILGFVLTTHLILVFSSLHCWWARLMLGSRSTRISGGPQPAQGGGGEPGTVKASTEELTDREQEVFMLMARGDTNADISEELFISEGTVKTHAKRIFSKLELRDRTQLVVFAYEYGLVTPASSPDALDSDAGYRG